MHSQAFRINNESDYGDRSPYFPIIEDRAKFDVTEIIGNLITK